MSITYKEHQLDLQAGDVIMYRNEFQWYRPMTYLSKAIRYFTEFSYNHVAVVVENNGVLFINEALIGGVTARPLKKFLERKKSFIAVLRPKEKVKPIVFSRKANEHIGVKYDVTSLIFHHTVYRIPKLLGFKYHGDWIGSTGRFATSKLVCSEYVGLVYNLPEWWLMSTKEVYTSNTFDLIFEEKQLLKNV